MKKFRGFMVHTHPSELTGAEAKRFLADLAVRRQVSAAAQNQAFNALLFLFRHVFKQELGDLSDTARAKRSKYIPTVLSRQEVESLVAELHEPYALLAMIMYGCGLRLSETANLRIHNFIFDTGMLSVQFGKGGTSRTVPLPHKIHGEIMRQFEKVRELHQEDIRGCLKSLRGVTSSATMAVLLWWCVAAAAAGLPPWPRVYHDFRVWQQDGTWLVRHDVLRGDFRVAAGRQRQPSAGSIESQAVKPPEQGGSAAMMPTHRSRVARAISSSRP